MSICQHIIEIMVLFSEGLSNPVHGEVYSIQHYVLKFVSDLFSPGYSGFLHHIVERGVKHHKTTIPYFQIIHNPIDRC